MFTKEIEAAMLAALAANDLDALTQVLDQLSPEEVITQTRKTVGYPFPAQESVSDGQARNREIAMIMLIVRRISTNPEIENLSPNQVIGKILLRIINQHAEDTGREILQAFYKAH